jgi:hypothetical protein
MIQTNNGRLRVLNNATARSVILAMSDYQQVWEAKRFDGRRALIGL